MNMKITKAYVTTLTEIELIALHKLIGNTSYGERSKLDLTPIENDSLSSLYGDIDNAINGE